MIKFIADYHKLGIGFSFRLYGNCGNLKVIITYFNEETNATLVGESCVNSEEFKNEEKLLNELTVIIKDMMDIND